MGACNFHSRDEAVWAADEQGHQGSLMSLSLVLPLDSNLLSVILKFVMPIRKVESDREAVKQHDHI
jgi:hypothetical protein